MTATGSLAAPANTHCFRAESRVRTGRPPYVPEVSEFATIEPPVARPQLTTAMRWMLATASGVAVANIYYNQPMLADIGRTFAAGAHETGLVATATQVGYAVGMPLFIPLGDFIDRRTLVSCLF